MDLSLPPAVRSKRYLWVLFVLALPVMMFIRWDVSAWLSSQVDALAQQAGINISYDQLALHGLGIRFKNIGLQQGLDHVVAEDLKLSLSLSSLLTGHLALDVDALWLDNSILFTIYQDNHLIHVQDVQAAVDLLNLADIQQQWPARASGTVNIRGDMILDQSNAKPQQGKLQLTWNNAMAGLSMPEFELGDYVVDIYSDTEQKMGWQWRVQGGEGVALAGRGTVDMQQPLMQQWRMTGALSVRVDPSQSTLSMMLQAFTGSNQAKIRLSGLLFKPHMQVVR